MVVSKSKSCKGLSEAGGGMVTMETGSREGDTGEGGGGVVRF